MRWESSKTFSFLHSGMHPGARETNRVHAQGGNMRSGQIASHADQTIYGHYVGRYLVNVDVLRDMCYISEGSVLALK